MHHYTPGTRVNHGATTNISHAGNLNLGTNYGKAGRFVVVLSVNLMSSYAMSLNLECCEFFLVLTVRRSLSPVVNLAPFLGSWVSCACILNLNPSKC